MEDKSVHLKRIDIKEKQNEFEAAIEEANTRREGEKSFDIEGVNVAEKQREIEAAIEETFKVRLIHSFIHSLIRG